MTSFQPRFLLALTAATALVACAKDPSADAPAAVVTEPTAEAPAAAESPVAQAAVAAPAAEAPAAPAAAAPAAAADAAKALTGTIGFVGSKVTGSHDCEFKTWTGTLRLAGGKAEGGQLSFAVDTASVVADVNSRGAFSEKLDGHLKSEDFFHSDKYPQATFASTAITAGGENGASHTIKGLLTLRGVQKEVAFPATIAVGATEATGKAEFTINRKDFGIQYAGKPDDLIREGVVIKVDVKAAL